MLRRTNTPSEKIEGCRRVDSTAISCFSFSVIVRPANFFHFFSLALQRCEGDVKACEDPQAAMYLSRLSYGIVRNHFMRTPQWSQVVGKFDQCVRDAVA